jgi:hypothetical protein
MPSPIQGNPIMAKKTSKKKVVAKKKVAKKKVAQKPVKKDVKEKLYPHVFAIQANGIVEFEYDGKVDVERLSDDQESEYAYKICDRYFGDLIANNFSYCDLSEGTLHGEGWAICKLDLPFTVTSDATETQLNHIIENALEHIAERADWETDESEFHVWLLEDRKPVLAIHDELLVKEGSMTRARAKERLKREGTGSFFTLLRKGRYGKKF